MRFLKQKVISNIPKEMLRLASRLGGVSSGELKMVLAECDQKECSKEFKALCKEGKIRKVLYVTLEIPEYRWIAVHQ